VSPAVWLCLEKKEHIVGSRAAGELLTLHKFSPGALSLSLLSWYISHSEPCALMYVQIKPFAKLTFQEKTYSPPSSQKTDAEILVLSSFECEGMCPQAPSSSTKQLSHFEA